MVTRYVVYGSTQQYIEKGGDTSSVEKTLVSLDGTEEVAVRSTSDRLLRDFVSNAVEHKMASGTVVYIGDKNFRRHETSTVAELIAQLLLLDQNALVFGAGGCCSSDNATVAVENNIVYIGG
jgi:hypothetical protein